MEERLEQIPPNPVPTKEEQDKDYWGEVKPEIAHEVDEKIKERVRKQLEELEESVLDNPLPPGTVPRAD